jgi:hypothetical protein
MLELVKLSFDKCVQIGRPFSARQPLPAHEFFKASGFFCMAEYDGPHVLSLIDSQSLAPVLFDIGLSRRRRLRDPPFCEAKVAAYTCYFDGRVSTR